jgi:hypothetical protein
MAVACVLLVLAGSPRLVWQFQNTRIPLAWVAGAAAILAFLADEYRDRAPEPVREEEQSAELLCEKALS